MAARTRRALIRGAVGGLVTGGLATRALAQYLTPPPNKPPITAAAPAPAPPRPPAAPPSQPAAPSISDPLAIVKAPVVRMQSFASAPYPYSGPGEDDRTPFYDIVDGLKRRGHRTSSGDVLWEGTTYGDDRALMYVPGGFDPRRPALIVVFFHGHGSIIERTVMVETELTRQISESGANAVLVAPQFAYDAADSSAGKFFRPGAFARFIDEAATKLARLLTPPGTDLRKLSGVFNLAPVVLVAFSGGYKPAAFVLSRGGATHRLGGVVLLDALYDEEDKYAAWFAGARSRAFLASFYTDSTAPYQAKLRDLLAKRRITSIASMPTSLARGTAAFVASGSIDRHGRFPLEGPPRDPVKTVLAAIPGYRMKPTPEELAKAKPPAKPPAKR